MDTLIDRMETNQEKVLKKIALYSTGILFIVAGVRHFIMPEYYMLMMPSYLPVPIDLIYLTGFLEVLWGIGLMLPHTRVFSAWGLMALALTFLPENIYMWTHNIHLHDAYTPNWPLMLRIPLQFLLIAWLYMFARNPKSY